ncbi:MAG: 4Fe-4S binding protein [Deltaproteobacteria bacterium]|nr:4Fe-4S binding protein [Deltaproteobacteria bacterium]
MSGDIYEQMTEKIMLKGSQIIPRLFEMIVDPLEAQLMMAMPGTPEQLAEKLSRPVSEIAEMCKVLYQKGTSFKSFKGDSVGYKMCRDMIQFHDATILWKDATLEFHDLWQQFIEDEWPGFARFYTQMLERPFTRIVPIDSSVETEKEQILDADSARKMINDAEVLAVTKCTCRLIAHKCDKPLEACIQLGNSARYAIDRESGREIDKIEALRILDETETAGLVHVTMNSTHAGHFICNCCSCCCQALPLMISEGLDICDPSRFMATIDPDLCDGCFSCMDRCLFNALTETQNTEGMAITKVIDEKCLGCGLCFSTCPTGAIILKETRPLEFIPSS